MQGAIDSKEQTAEWMTSYLQPVYNFFAVKVMFAKERI